MAASVYDRAIPTFSTATTFDLSVPAFLPGHHIYCPVLVYAQFVDTLGPCGDLAVPEPWELVASADITESSTVVGKVFLLVAIGGDDPLDATLTNPVDADQRIAVSGAVAIEGAGGRPGTDAVVEGPLQTEDPDAPAITITQDDSIGLMTVIGAGALPVSPVFAAPWVGEGAHNMLALYGAFTGWWSVPARDTDLPAALAKIAVPVIQTDDSAGWYFYISTQVIPAAPAAAFAATTLDLSRLRLRCADDYRAYITEGDYETVVDSIPWTDISWSRALDESGTAVVTSPDRLGGVNCVSHLGGLRPWRHGLMVERNDIGVWRGPITQLRRVQGAIQVTANDVFARFAKRLATRDEEIEFSNVDAGVAFATIIASAQISGEMWGLTAPDILTLAPFSRIIRGADLEVAGDLLNDLAESAVDFYIANGVLYVHEFGSGWKYHDGFTTNILDGPYNTRREFEYGMFTERTFTGTVLWSMNGLAQGNTVWVAGADNAEEGTRDVYSAVELSSVVQDGVLDLVASGNLHQPGDVAVPAGVFQLQAASILAQRAHTPAVIEATPLAEGAPVDVDNLRPGSIWLLDIWDHGYGQLLQRARLKRVEVRVTKDQQGEISETVVPTLYPVGYEE